MLIFLVWLVVASYFILRILLGLPWGCIVPGWNLFLCPLGYFWSMLRGLRLGFSHSDHVTSGDIHLLFRSSCFLCRGRVIPPDGDQPVPVGFEWSLMCKRPGRRRAS